MPTREAGPRWTAVGAQGRDGPAHAPTGVGDRVDQAAPGRRRTRPPRPASLGLLDPRRPARPSQTRPTASPTIAIQPRPPGGRRDGRNARRGAGPAACRLQGDERRGVAAVLRQPLSIKRRARRVAVEASRSTTRARRGALLHRASGNSRPTDQDERQRHERGGDCSRKPAPHWPTARRRGRTKALSRVSSTTVRKGAGPGAQDGRPREEGPRLAFADHRHDHRHQHAEAGPASPGTA